MAEADPESVGKDPEYLSTLERGLRVLVAFDEAHPEMTLSEVAARTDLSPAVVRRCLKTLVELGYIGQYERKFLLRPSVLTIGSAFLASMQIEQVVLPPLQGLRDQTGDSASLAVLSGAEILYVAHVSTDRRFRVAAGVGTRFPFHATSLGKALAAPEVIRVLLGPQWGAAVPLAQALAVGMLPSALFALGGSLLAALGQVQRRLKVSLWYGPLHVLALLLAGFRSPLPAPQCNPHPSAQPDQQQTVALRRVCVAAVPF